MTFKSLFAAALVAGFAIPAVAQAADFYIVQDVKTKKCQIVAQKPTTGGEWTMISPEGKVYKTQDEAQSAMKTMTVCETK